MRRFARRVLIWAIGLAVVVALVWWLRGWGTDHFRGNAAGFALAFAVVLAIGAAAIWLAWRRPSRRR